MTLVPLAPLIIAIAYLVASQAGLGLPNTEIERSLILLSAVFAIPVVWILGPPAIIFFRRQNITSLWSHLAFGTMVGVLGSLIFPPLVLFGAPYGFAVGLGIWATFRIAVPEQRCGPG